VVRHHWKACQLLPSAFVSDALVLPSPPLSIGNILKRTAPAAGGEMEQFSFWSIRHFSFFLSFFSSLEMLRIIDVAKGVTAASPLSLFSFFSFADPPCFAARSKPRPANRFRQEVALPLSFPSSLGSRTGRGRVERPIF